MSNFIIVETTCPNKDTAQKIATILLEQKLAGCVHFFTIQSSYYWQNKIVNDDEILLRIKTRKDSFLELEKVIKLNHPYEVPQIISLKIDDAAKSYLAWLDELYKNDK